MNIYVASSWQNPYYEKTCNQLREAGFFVYDFKNKDTAFSWEEVDLQKYCTLKELMIALQKAKPVKAFTSDLKALREADAVLLLTPSGRSSHLELGYAIGLNKPSVILIKENFFEPDLVYKMADLITDNLVDAVNFLKRNLHA